MPGTTTVRVESIGNVRAIGADGMPRPAVVDDQPFRVELERFEDVEVDEHGDLVNGAPTTTVTMSSTTGDDKTVTVRWDGATTGRLRYVSEELTAEWGGGSRLSIAGFEFNIGESLDNAENGEPIVLTADGGESGSVRIYDAATQLVANEAHLAIGEAIGIYTNVILNARGGIEFFEANRDLDPDGSTRERLRRQEADAEHRREIAQHAQSRLRSEHLDQPEQAAVGREAIRILSLPPGSLEVNSFRKAVELMGQARTRGHDDFVDFYERGIFSAGIGLYQVVTDVTLTGAGYTVVTGETVTGVEATSLERWLAVLQLVLAAADIGAIVTWERSLLANQARRLAQGEGVLTAEADALKAGLGQNLAPADVGMLSAAARDAARIARKHEVIAVVRPTNIWSMFWRRRGAQPKPMALKAKTVNELDQLLGADPHLPPGRVGFFDPRLPDDEVLAAMDPEQATALRSRYQQRHDEYHGPTGDKIRGLIDKGEYRVADGILFTPDGRAITGDHDLWEILTRAGVPVSRDVYDAVVEELMSSTGFWARHGAHMRWMVRRADYASDAALATDKGIFDKIVGSHVEGEEVLIAFDGYTPPYALYSDAAGLPLRLRAATPDVQGQVLGRAVVEGAATAGVVTSPLVHVDRVATSSATAPEAGGRRISLRLVALMVAFPLLVALVIAFAAMGGDDDPGPTAVDAGGTPSVVAPAGDATPDDATAEEGSAAGVGATPEDPPDDAAGAGAGAAAHRAVVGNAAQLSLVDPVYWNCRDVARIGPAADAPVPALVLWIDVAGGGTATVIVAQAPPTSAIESWHFTGDAEQLGFTAEPISYRSCDFGADPRTTDHVECDGGLVGAWGVLDRDPTASPDFGISVYLPDPTAGPDFTTSYSTSLRDTPLVPVDTSAGESLDVVLDAPPVFTSCAQEIVDAEAFLGS